jgi:hypothetical protein
MSIKGLEIDYDTADRITIAALKDSRKYLKKELKRGAKGKCYLHPDDEVYNTRLIEAINIILDYHGEL